MKTKKTNSHLRPLPTIPAPPSQQPISKKLLLKPFRNKLPVKLKTKSKLRKNRLFHRYMRTAYLSLTIGRMELLEI